MFLLQLPRKSNQFSLLVALVPAIVLSLCLFYLMQYLITGSGQHINQVANYSTLDFIRLKRDEQSQARKRQLPPKTKTTKRPPTPKIEAVSENIKPLMPELNMDIPKLGAFKLGTGPFLGDINELKSDSDIIPLVRVEPRYPRKAARAGKQGWVKLEFTIAEDGSVIDAKVVDAKPKRTFNREAIRAIQRWKFKPKIVNGKPVKQTASQVIDFKLEK